MSIKLVIAILIAASGVVSSVAAWRADVSDRHRADDLKAADFQERDRQAAVQEIDANLNDSRVTLVRVRVDERRAGALAAHARDRSVSSPARRRARALAAGYRAMAAVVRDRIDPDVLTRGAKPAAFDRARRLALSSSAARRDLDPKPELDRAADADQRADDLRVLGVAALIAALFLACAEVTSASWYRLYLGIGLLVLVATIVLMMVVGLG
jgi:hypothetical protein